MSSLRDFQAKVTAAMRGDKPAPPPDEFDPQKFPFACDAGANNSNATDCPTCGKPPTDPKRQGFPDKMFLFRDLLSAQEYRISAMCQACQDSVFAHSAFAHDEDNEGEDDIETELDPDKAREIERERIEREHEREHPASDDEG